MNEGNPTPEHGFHKYRLCPSPQARKSALGGMIDKTVDDRAGLARLRQNLQHPSDRARPGVIGESANERTVRAATRA